MSHRTMLMTACILLPASDSAYDAKETTAGDYTLGEIAVETSKESEEKSLLQNRLGSGRYINIGEALIELRGQCREKGAASATGPVIRDLVSSGSA